MYMGIRKHNKRLIKICCIQIAVTYTHCLNYINNTCHSSPGMSFKNKVLLTSLNNLPFEEYRRLLTEVNNEDYCTSPPVKPAPVDTICITIAVNLWIGKVTSFVGVNIVGRKFLKLIHISNLFNTNLLLSIRNSLGWHIYY